MVLGDHIGRYKSHRVKDKSVKNSRSSLLFCWTQIFGSLKGIGKHGGITKRWHWE